MKSALRNDDLFPDQPSSSNEPMLAADYEEADEDEAEIIDGLGVWDNCLADEPDEGEDDEDIHILTTFCTAAVDATGKSFKLRPFKIDLGAQIPRLHSLVNNTLLPEKELYPAAGPVFGIGLDTVRELKDEWLHSYNWSSEQEKLNEVAHYTAVVEGLTIHFLHEKSKDPDAIPIIMLHGWPGSFYEFFPVIKPLTQASTSSTGKKVSFHVVVPSLPGFVFSSPAPANWTVSDNARVFNTLMTEVLGYSKYAMHGTDWGANIGYHMYSEFNTTVRAAQFSFIPFFPPTDAELAANNITLSPVNAIAHQNWLAWGTTGNSRPNDLGLALYDNPVGQLAWVAAKWKRWSDPRAGTPPSVLNNTAILTGVSLYVLTHTFISAAWIYAQNPNAYPTVYTKAPTDAPLLYAAYAYNNGFWTEEYAAQVGNLVSYVEHDFGGHFPGLDNPPALIEDIRRLGPYFKR
ncbi:Alpha/Beta hydrolase protein [Mycena crocata]|nr:Alpha/Beta hydrolase protein [Mycena crocata]